MNYKFRAEGKPVAIELYSQRSYTENPFRQIEYELLFIEQGKGTIFFGNTVSRVNEGDFIFINSFEEHCLKMDDKKKLFKCYRLLFEISAFGNDSDPCRTFFLSVRFCRFLKLPEEIILRIKKYSEDNEACAGRDLILRALLMDILVYAVNTNQYEMISQENPQLKRRVSAIENALRYIKSNYSENLSLRMILQLTNYSKSQFIRLFKESTGLNVSEYINKYRIEKACLDLMYTNKNITEIATANGFNNIQYFSRRFKEYMNCTPKQYQKKCKKITSR